MSLLGRGPDGSLTLDLSARSAPAQTGAVTIEPAPAKPGLSDHPPSGGLDYAVAVLLVTVLGLALFFRSRLGKGGDEPIEASVRRRLPRIPNEDDERRAFLARYGGQDGA